MKSDVPADTRSNALYETLRERLLVGITQGREEAALTNRRFPAQETPVASPYSPSPKGDAVRVPASYGRR